MNQFEIFDYKFIKKFIMFYIRALNFKEHENKVVYSFDIFV